MHTNLTSFFKHIGVSDIYFCAGSRNSSLINELNSFQLHFEFDERKASFQALGHARITKSPVVVCVTSGTALTECFSAVVEAYYSETPLIILSADRPARLYDSHAPQCINQRNLYGTFVQSSYNGPLDEFNYVNYECRLPLHINIEIDDAKKIVPTRKVEVLSHLDFVKKLEQIKPILLITEGHNLSSVEISALENLELDLFIECTANIHLNRDYLYLDKDIIEAIESDAYNAVIKIGRTPISKLWRLLDNSFTDVEVYSTTLKSGLGRGYFCDFSNDKLIESLSNISFTHKKGHEDILSNLIIKYPTSELSVINNIIDKISDDDLIYVGNSMPIRYVQMLNCNNEIYASRGANGIDGQIATAIGIASGINKKIHCIVGDLTYLYDIGSTVQGLPANLYIHVLNNNGGQIFNRVKTDPRIKCEHTYDLDSLANISQNIFIYNIDNASTELFWSEYK